MSGAVDQRTIREGRWGGESVIASISPSGDAAGSAAIVVSRWNVSPATMPADRSRIRAVIAFPVTSTVNAEYSSSGGPPNTPANASSNERRRRAVIRAQRSRSALSPFLSTSHSTNAEPARYAIDPSHSPFRRFSSS